MGLIRVLEAAYPGGVGGLSVNQVAAKRLLRHRRSIGLCTPPPPRFRTWTVANGTFVFGCWAADNPEQSMAVSPGGSRWNDLGPPFPIPILGERPEAKRCELKVKILALPLDHRRRVTLRARH